MENSGCNFQWFMDMAVRDLDKTRVDVDDLIVYSHAELAGNT